MNRHNIELGILVFFNAHALIHNSGLKIELHIGSDRRAYHRDKEQDIVLIEPECGARRSAIATSCHGGFAMKAGENISKVDHADGNEESVPHCLKFPFTTTNQTTKAEGYGDILMHAEKLHTGRNTGKFGDGMLRFAMMKRTMTASVTRTPNCSRTISANPLPVTTPMRDDHFLDHGQGKVMRTSAHRRPYPSFAPMME